MSHDIDEALIGLRDALAADTDLTALLGDATQIYRDRQIRKKVSYPILTLLADADNPQFQISGTGVWRPDIEIGIHAVKESTCRAILAVLDENFDLPRNRTTPINSDHFSITLFRRTNAVPLGPITLVDTDEPIHLLTTLWQSRIHKTS